MAYAQGLRPIRHEDGSPWCGAVTPCQVLASYGTAVFVGDPVIAVGASTTQITAESAVKEGAYMAVNVAGAGGVIYGVVVGVEPTRSNLEQKHLPASTGGIVYVARATPDLIFTVGEDGVTDALELADIGSTVDLVAGAGGSTATGYSSFVIDSNTDGTVARQCYLRGIHNVSGNIDNVDTATATDTIWEVSIMEIQFAINPIGLGV